MSTFKHPLIIRWLCAIIDVTLFVSLFLYLCFLLYAS